MPGFGTTKRQSISRMRHRVSVQRQLISETDDRGQPVYTWSNVATNVPCAIKTLSGGEAEKARQLYADATHRVEMRTLGETIDEKMKLVFQGRNLFIGFIDEIDQVGRFTTLLVAEKK